MMNSPHGHTERPGLQEFGINLPHSRQKYQ